jgi:hypothetical protein
MDSKEMLDRLRFCPNCNSDCVSPAEWEQLPSCPEWPCHWIVTRYCGECEIFSTDIHSQEECELWDEWLDDCLAEIKRAEKRLTRANMEDEVEAFIKLIEHDIILPEDF